MEYLVSRGHNEHDVIHKYSLDKVQAYVGVAQEAQQGELLELALAFHNPKQLVKDMKRAMRARQSTDGGVVTKGELNRLRKLASRRR